MVNVFILVTDADLVVGDLFTGLAILQLLGVDTKTLLEKRRDLLDGSDCSSIRVANVGTNGGRVSRLMIARLSRLPNPETPSDNLLHVHCSRVNYFKLPDEKEPFPNANFLDPVNSVQPQEI